MVEVALEHIRCGPPQTTPGSGGLCVGRRGNDGGLRSRQGCQVPVVAEGSRNGAGIGRNPTRGGPVSGGIQVPAGTHRRLSIAQLRALAQAQSSSDTQPLFEQNLVAARTTVANLDRFDLAGRKPNGRARPKLPRNRA